MSAEAMDTRQEAMRRAGQDETERRMNGGENREGREWREGRTTTGSRGDAEARRETADGGENREGREWREGRTTTGSRGDAEARRETADGGGNREGREWREGRTTTGSRGDAEARRETADGGADHGEHGGHGERRGSREVSKNAKDGDALAMTCPVCGLGARGVVRMIGGRALVVHGQSVREDGEAIVFGCVEND